jgi:hypothetical protein
MNNDKKTIVGQPPKLCHVIEHYSAIDGSPLSESSTGWHGGQSPPTTPVSLEERRVALGAVHPQGNRFVLFLAWNKPLLKQNHFWSSLT